MIAVPSHELPRVLDHIMPPSGMSQCGVVAELHGQQLCPCSLPLRPLKLHFVGKGGRGLEVTLSSKDLLSFVGAMDRSVQPPRRMCRLTVQPAPPDVPAWILGDVFLRHVYVVHDVFGTRVVMYKQEVSRSFLFTELPQLQELPLRMLVVAVAAVSLAAGVALRLSGFCRRMRTRSVSDDYMPL